MASQVHKVSGSLLEKSIILSADQDEPGWQLFEKKYNTGVLEIILAISLL